MNTLETPILFVIFNRKETALTSLKAIKEARPKRMYISGDGARKHIAGEEENVKATRAGVLAAIDWDCDVKTLFQDKNLGCGLGVYTAINWFFEQEEQGIILEDDCVAKPSFFTYVEELLHRYKDDNRIAQISGFNELGETFSQDSYGFSSYIVCWGWATWRSAWQNMDFDMKWRSTQQKDDILSNCGYKGRDYTYWKRRVQAIDDQLVSAWDYQWCFSVASQNQLGIFPNTNLISNIGFDKDATHTGKSPFINYDASSDLSFPLKHPKYVLANLKFDKQFYKARNAFINNIAWFFPKPIKDAARKGIAFVMGRG
ncbi:MAG: hypothetical protein ACJART_002119 [Maribacter sp.]|jgi:hypothetical protein